MLARVHITYDAVNNACDAKYRYYRVDILSNDLREGKGRYVDDDGQIRKERDDEEYRGKGSD
jgi:hypothetical protein